MNEDIIEIIDDVDSVSPQTSNAGKGILEKKVSEATYNTIEPELETIEIIEDYEPSSNKSGLVLIIVLFVILVVFVIFLPQISEIFGRFS